MSVERASALTGAYPRGSHLHRLAYTRLREEIVALPHARVFLAFLIAALAVRLVFWLYTGRIWEDGLMALTAARNAWEGFGLTHHASEPRVYCFTSPLSEMVMLAGEAVGQGLLAMRIASLIATVPTLYYAYRISLLFGFGIPALAVLLAYLAFDQLQIFYGMAGMETQIATALAVANAYYFLTSQWRKLGVALGLGLLCRPEFVFWAPLVGIFLLFHDRRALLTVVTISAAVFMPWTALATIYYGSPIPHTISAKSLSFHWMPGTHRWQAIYDYLPNWWHSFAPLREHVMGAPRGVPETAIRAVVILVTLLAAIGAGWLVAQSRRTAAIVLFILIFAAYRTMSLISIYGNWYLVPFLALFFIFVAAGVELIHRHWPRIAIPVAAVVAFCYAVHVPLSFPRERNVQLYTNDAVQTVTGKRLNALMSASDTVVLEPLGYIGWAARNKTIYDSPGIGSKVSTAALLHTHESVWGLAAALRPTFLVMRPRELEELGVAYPDVAKLYQQVDEVKAPPDYQACAWGYCVYGETDLIILKRTQ
ncbi:MAG: hypothetical protein JO328_13830 [Hyphomicrobiales bacterium]|nr:hypothetical protein [Hyphomicrobiales bacterium]MBV9426654.1 hypothetical protein [Bradyrhizobiaceae bacterium]